MTPDAISNWLIDTFDHVVPKSAWGETSFFVNPQNRLPSGAYFATLKEKNGDNDKASNLDRDNVFRLNFGPHRKLFEENFGTPPKRPAKGEIIKGEWDFTKLDTLSPHPIYGWMSWMAVVNPSEETFERCKILLSSAHEKAMTNVMKRLEKMA